MPTRRALLALIPAGLLLAHCACASPGRRLLHATITVDGTTVLDLLYDDTGYEPAEEVWAYLEQQPVGGGPSGLGVTATEGKPLEAALTGTIVIGVTHARDPIVEHRTDRVALVRSSATSDHWHLAPGECARIAGK